MNTRPLYTRRSLLKLLGTSAAAAPLVTSNLMAQASVRKIRHASFGASGQGWADLTQFAHCKNLDVVAICDVDLSQMKKAKERFPNARFYQDWRQLLEKEAGNIDSVNVTIPDHMHAPVGVSAMQLGKHVYGQKPLAHELHEVRRMTEVAKESGVVTQMGIQIHSTAYYRMGVRMIQDGAIGKIKAVHCRSSKSWGDDSAKPDRTDPVPKDFDWDLWLGVCAKRPFIGNRYYHPFNWRKRLDFGTGTLGDMGCHILDPVYESIGLSAPIAVRSEGPAPNPWNWALNGQVSYTFAGTPRTADKTLPITWYDGTSMPPQEIVALLEGKPFPNQGSLFIGTEGVMLLPHVSTPKLFPAAKFKGYEYPRVKGSNHYGDFIEACRGNGKTTAGFDYAGPLTEAILLGCIASRFPNKTLKWDSPGLKFDLAEANQFVSRTYRDGWKVEGLG